MALNDRDVEWDGSRHRWSEVMDGDGRVVHVAWLPSRQEALEAVGLSE